jgi:N-acyl-D-aspartate/D-glutamate deacylase
MIRRMALFLVALVLLVAPVHAQQRFDVLIRGGLVLDGTGNPWFHADVALTGDRIAAIGDLSQATAAEVVDATGLYVAPGFIDVHSHAGGGLTDPALKPAHPLLAQGITTVFINPDGGGPVDLATQREALLRGGIGVNAAQFVPHGSVRSEVIGPFDRLATPEELERMRALVRRGMEEGAFGLSSGPFYAPGSYSDTHELVELAKVVAPFGGAYTSHVRDEADYTIGLMASLEEVITVGREAGIPTVHTHIKALGPGVWGFSDSLIARVERARAAGVEVWADQYPYVASSTGLAAALLPRWAESGGRDSLLVRLADAGTVERIKVEIRDNLARRAGAARIQFRRYPPDPSIEGRTLADVARGMGVDPIEAAVRLFRQGSPSIISFNMDEKDVKRLMAQPWMMTSSDGDLVPIGEGAAHPRSYGTFPRKLRTYVLDEKTIDLAFAIRSMTALPAQVFRLPDRGQLRAGLAADVVVFDLARVRDVGTYADPHHLAEGMVDVWVNGERAVRGGVPTGRMGGRVLRR